MPLRQDEFPAPDRDHDNSYRRDWTDRHRWAGPCAQSVTVTVMVQKWRCPLWRHRHLVHWRPWRERELANKYHQRRRDRERQLDPRRFYGRRNSLTASLPNGATAMITATGTAAAFSSL